MSVETKLTPDRMKPEERLRRAPSTISFHLRRLEEASLVCKTRTQYYLVYSARPEVLDMRLRELVAVPAEPDGQEAHRLKKYRQKVLSSFMRKGRLVQMPKQWRKRRIILDEFLAKFESGRVYQEHEVNQRIATTFEDYCRIRRMLVDEGTMTRDGQEYRKVGAALEPTGPEFQTGGAEQVVAQDVPMETRAELKRRYKETPRQAGIFLITNTVNGRVFLGSSTNLHGPINKHRFLLSHGMHWIKKLQGDWNKCGPNSFKFEVVEVVKPKDDPDFRVEDELSLLEEIWIEKTRPLGEGGYNTDLRIRE